MIVFYQRPQSLATPEARVKRQFQEPASEKPASEKPASEKAAAARKPAAMSDSPPDRLSTNPNSPYYDADVLARDVGIRFKGVEKTNVEEYCVSEGWIRVAAGAAKD